MENLRGNHRKNKRLSLDSNTEIQRFYEGNPESQLNGFKQLEKKPRSIDLGFFRFWRQPEFISRQVRKKLTRQCKSLEGVIPEEDSSRDNSLSKQKKQTQGRSLDSFLFSTVLKKFGRSLTANR